MLKPGLKTVLVDMDGVLADFDGEVSRRLSDRHPHVPIVAQRTNFYIAEDYPEHMTLVRKIFSEARFFDSLPLVEYALEGWQRIIDLGYEPIVCSSPIVSNPHSAKEKLSWLDKHLVPAFGKQVVEQAIITRNKYEYRGIALIDDRPELRNADKATWRHIVFDRPYNEHSKEPRLFGWDDENLSGLLEEAEKSGSSRN